MSAKPDKTYRIVQLQSENVKRLKAVSITPEGNLIEVTGRNGAGKSSLLDSVFWGLSGKSSSKQPSPIRSGEEKATIKLDLGSLTVTRRFIAQDDGTYTHTLVVESEEGARFQKPQNVLDQLVGELAMDPLEFTRMKPEAQFDALRRFVPDYDFDASLDANNNDFKARTDVNRRMKDAQAQATGIDVPDDTPDESIDEAALVADLEGAGQHNASVEKRKANRETVAGNIEGRRRLNAQRLEKIKSHEDEISALKLAIAEDVNAIEADEKRLADAGPLPDPTDTADIVAKIEAARRTNAAVTRKKRRAELIAAAAKLKAESESLTRKMDERDQEKAEAIAKAKMPVDGIGFGDGIVTLNGQPFDQASSAEQLRASIALAMAENPRLRIIIVRDGALLDDDSMRVVAEMAEKHDIQCWIETVASDRPGAIVIEDGMIKQDEPVLQAAE